MTLGKKGACLNGNDLDDGEILDELLGARGNQALVVDIPRSALKIEPLHIASRLKSLVYLFGVCELGDRCVQR